MAPHIGWMDSENQPFNTATFFASGLGRNTKARRLLLFTAV
jgi:hypothetical protein